MWKIGVSFQSHQSAEDIVSHYIRPLRVSLRKEQLGIYSNHLQQRSSGEGEQPTEHLIVFEVHDFKRGLRHLRTQFEKLGAPNGTTFHNLNDCDPLY